MEQLKKDIKTLRDFNEWRRSKTMDSRMPNPKDVGLCIDRCLVILEEFKARKYH